MPDSFDPYKKWLAIPPAEQPPNHYRLLGVPLFEEDPDVIETASDQRMMLLRSMQTGQNAKLSQKLLNEVSAAKVCLLDPPRRAAYDAELQRQFEKPATPTAAPPKPRTPEPVAVQAPAVVISTEPKTAAPRPAARQEKQLWHNPLVIAGAVIGLLLLTVVAVIANRGGTRDANVSDANTFNRPTGEETAKPSDNREPSASNPIRTPKAGQADRVALRNDAVLRPDAAEAKPAVVGNDTPGKGVAVDYKNYTLQRNWDVDDLIVRCITFSPDGKTVAIACHNQTVQLWDVASGKKTATLSGHGEMVTRVTFSPDGALLAAVTWIFKPGKVWDLKTQTEKLAIQQHEVSNTRSVTDAAFSPDGKILATSNSYKTIKLLDVASGEELATLDCHDRISRVAFSPDGKMLVTAHGHLWDLDSKTEVAAIKRPGTGTDVVFYPDGTKFATCGSMTGMVWDVSTVSSQRELFVLKGHTGVITSIAISPDGRVLATGSGDKTVKLWDAATGDEIATLSGYEHEVCSIDFSPDGTLLATCQKRGKDETARPVVRIWRFGASGKAPDTSPKPDRLPGSNAYALRFADRDFVTVTGAREAMNLSKTFTAEMWVRWPREQAIRLMGTNIGAPTNPRWSSNAWRLVLGGYRPPMKIGFHYATSPSGGSGLNASQAVAVSAWHHVAVCHQPDEQTALFIDGKLARKKRVSKYHDEPVGEFRIGSEPSYSDPFFGDVAALRLSETIRYASDFQPPTPQQIQSDDDTIAVLDFSRATQGRIADLSGNEHHGGISGAEWIRLED